MTGKEFLEPLKYIQMDIATKRDQILSLHESLESITPAYREKIGSSGYRNVHSMSEKICEAVDLEQELSASLEELVSVQSSIITAINEIPDTTSRAILHWRYVKNLSWSVVASKLQMTEDAVYKRHRSALSALEKTISFQRKSKSEFTKNS